ncbi:MAG: hypothetical protein GMKNLPBB_00471 [Myxococcota bacterium]|nr:hypothetical protein [Myxococcota bacterium]
MTPMFWKLPALVAALVISPWLMGCNNRSGRIQPAAFTLTTDQIRQARDAMSTLGPGDTIEVRIFGEDKLSGQYNVFSNGTIRMPMIKEVQVAGLTANQAADLISAKYREGYLKDPQVTVFISNAKSKKIFIIGEIKETGTFPYNEQMTVIQAITLCKGYTDSASPNEAQILRIVNGEEVRFTVPLEDIMRGKVKNFLLLPGDILYVPRSVF